MKCIVLLHDPTWFLDNDGIDWSHSGGNPRVFLDTKKIWLEFLTEFKDPDFKIIFWVQDPKASETVFNSMNNTLLIPGGKPGTYWGLDAITTYYKPIAKFFDSFDYNFILITTLGSFWDFSKLKNILENTPREKIYTGHVANNGKREYAAGHACIFTKDLAKLIIDNDEQIILNEHGGETDDVQLAYFFSSRGVNITKIFSEHAYVEPVWGAIPLSEQIKSDEVKGLVHYRIKEIRNRHFKDPIILKKLYQRASENKWAIVLFSNEPYIQKALNTIHQARTIGNWKDDIVLLVPESLSENIKPFCQEFLVEQRIIPVRDVSSIIDAWEQNKDHPNYSYIKSREFMYMKFYVFDKFFKKWDKVFYMDSGMVIQGDLTRMKVACSPDNCIYAHSDAYPYTNGWVLRNQFCMDLFSEEQSHELEALNMDRDYFQGTMFIYDTKIIESDTVDKLFDLAMKYKFTIRMDQGILNLHFTSNWKQIPLADSVGFLYDFLERDPHKRSDYLMLKYPRFT